MKTENVYVLNDQELMEIGGGFDDIIYDALYLVSRGVKKLTDWWNALGERENPPMPVIKCGYGIHDCY